MKKEIHFIFLIILFLVVGAVSWNFYFKTFLQDDTVDIHLFPKTVGAWTSEEVPITELEYEILETRNAFTRKYSHPDGKEVFLFIVYSQNNRKVSHPPEICYTGGGFSILSNVHDVIPTDSENFVLQANKLQLERGSFKQIAYYWFKVGDSFTSNYWKQQIIIAFKTLLGQPASSALIRVSSMHHDRPESQAVEEVKEFTSLILPDLREYLP